MAEDTQSKDWTALKVHEACERMQRVEFERAQDRALLDNQFNGGRPYTKEEQEKYQIHINVNWLEGQRLMFTATNQLNNSLIFKERFFSAQSKGGKVEKRDEYSEFFTRNIHEPLKTGFTGQRTTFLLKNRNSCVAMHGIGPVMWMNGFRWRPRFIPLEDLLIPTDTLCDFSNLMFFAVNLYLTSGEFFDMTHGTNTKVQTDWNTDAVKKILSFMVKPDQQQRSQFDWYNQPEKMVEWVKQNRCALDTDAATKVKLRLFFYKDAETKKWKRCVMLREGMGDQPADREFIFDGRKKDFADSIDRIMHVQFGDNSICAPLKYHSVRGLAVLLYSPVEANNRLRCELLQHVFFNLKTLMRVNNPSDRDRPKVLDLSQYSVVEDGWTFVPAAERYQIDARLVEAMQGQMRQLMDEGSGSYVQSIAPGQSSQPRTAYETGVLSTQANQQVSAMLQSMYAQEEFLWQEEVRRFCDKTSEDDEVKEFQRACKRDGIPDELMVASNWAVKVERALGAGDQMAAVQESSALLSQKQWMDPKSQRLVERKWVTTITRDPAMGRLLVPEDPSEATPGVIAAEDVFGTLMEGQPAAIREGIDRGPYVESLIGMMGNKIQQITNIDNMGTPQEFIGLNTVAQHIQQNIQILSQDESEKQKVKLYGDELGKLMNLVKAFGERQQEAAKQKQVDPEVQAKLAAQQALTDQKIQASTATTEQRLQQGQAEFIQRMQQKQKEFEQQMAMEIQKHQIEVAKTMATTTTQIASTQAKTESDIANAKKKADAAPAPTVNK